jgi:predicted nucleotidyltransferase
VIKLDTIKKCRDILINYEAIIFAYIFGSYAKGNVKEDSDIDIAIYLKDSIGTYAYLDMKMELSEALKREVDLVILNDSTSLLKYEIYKKNILLFTHDESIENRYKVKILFEYDDMKRYLDLSYDKTIERMKEEVSING